MRLVILIVHAFQTTSTSPVWGRPTEYVSVKSLAIRYFDKYDFVDMPIAELGFVDEALKFARTVSVQLETQFIEAIGRAVGELEYMLSLKYTGYEFIDDRISPMLVKLMSASRLLKYALMETHKEIIDSYIDGAYQIISSNVDWDQIICERVQGNAFANFVLMCFIRNGLPYEEISRNDKCFKQGYSQMEGLYIVSAREMFEFRDKHNPVNIGMDLRILFSDLEKLCNDSCLSIPLPDLSIDLYDLYLNYINNVILQPAVGTPEERSLEFRQFLVNFGVLRNRRTIY